MAEVKKRKSGVGRKPSKPDYDSGKILQEQMAAAAALYNSDQPLQTIADALNLNPIKVRKLLITAGVYESDVAEQVNRAFASHRAGLSYIEAVRATMKELNLSKASVTSYLPYEKGVYFSVEESAEKISVGAERIRRLRKRKRVLEELLDKHSEEALWAAVVEFKGYKFRTYSGLPFSYSLKKGRNGVYTKELFIDRRENSKSLAWSSVLLVFSNIAEVGGMVEGHKPLIDRPKALGDIRGVTYIYGIFYRFGLIDVPDRIKEKMNKKGGNC